MSVLTQNRHYNGKIYKFIVAGKQQAKSPTWDPKKDENPPLSAAQALTKAREFIATIKTEDTLEWEFEGLTLVNFEGWMWQARYSLVRKTGIMTGAWPNMDCWILMDGTVIQPSITEDTK